MCMWPCGIRTTNTTFFRGETFRRKFANLGEVRSLIPECVKMMATATVETRKAVCKTLGMVNPAIIAESPSKVNIKYIVHHNPGTLVETFAPLVEELRRYYRPGNCVVSYIRLLCPHLSETGCIESSQNLLVLLTSLDFD